MLTQWNISEPSNARRRRSAERGRKIRARCIEVETGSGRNGRNSSVNRNNPLCGFGDLYARRRNIWGETNRGNARPITRFCRIFRSGGRAAADLPVGRARKIWNTQSTASRRKTHPLSFCSLRRVLVACVGERKWLLLIGSGLPCSFLHVFLFPTDEGAIGSFRYQKGMHQRATWAPDMFYINSILCKVMRMNLMIV